MYCCDIEELMDVGGKVSHIGSLRLNISNIDCESVA